MAWKLCTLYTHKGTKIKIPEYIIEFYVNILKVFRLATGSVKDLWFMDVIKTHWGGVTHMCVGKLTIIGSDNGLSPEQHQAIIWTNAGILLIGPLGTNFSEILNGIHTLSF